MRLSFFKVEDRGRSRLVISNKDFEVLISYQTPVAVFCKRTGEMYIAKQLPSRTTKRHVGQFMSDKNTWSPKVVTQEKLEEVYGGHVFRSDKAESEALDGRHDDVELVASE